MAKLKIILLGLAVLLVNLMVYLVITYQDTTVTDINLIHRQIETPLKLWLNGYLGHFFGFKYLGNISWLILPLLLYHLVKTDFFKPKWRQALLFSYSLTLILVGLKGYFNSRYQLTMFPVSIVGMMILLYLFLEKENLKTYTNWVILYLIGMVLLNGIVGYTFLKFSTETRIIPNMSQSGILPKIIKFAEEVPEKTKRAWHKIQSIEEKRQSIPYPVVQFIRTLPEESMFLVNNLPLLYYYTEKRGVFYWSGDDIYFYKNGKNSIMEKRSLEEMQSFIVDSLKCDYLFSTPLYNTYDSKFEDFTIRYCKPVFLDYAQFVVYEIMEEAGNYSIDSLASELSFKIKNSKPPYYVTTYAYDDQE